MQSTPETCVSGRNEKRNAPTRPLLAACIAGVLFSLSAPPYGLSWLSWLVPGILFAVSGTGPRLYALACGITFVAVVAALTSPFGARMAIAVIHPGIACGAMLFAYAVLRPHLSAVRRPLLAAVLWVACDWMIDATAFRATSLVVAMASVGTVEMIAVNHMWIGPRALRSYMLWPAVALLAVVLAGQFSLERRPIDMAPGKAVAELGDTWAAFADQTGAVTVQPLDR